MSKSVWIAGVIFIFAIGGVFYSLRGSSGSSDGRTASVTSVVIKGSDTEVQLVSDLAEAFHAQHADADISVTGGGSGAGIVAILNKEIDIANSSRPMKDEEWKTAQDTGLEVQEFVVARDGLSAIIHPDNSIKTLTMEKLGKIYRGEIQDWKDVGGQAGKIVLYGRQSTSGTYNFFRDTVLKADYAKTMREMEGNQAIVDAVRNDKVGIGYVGVGYVKDAGSVRDDIKVLTIAKDSKSVAISPLDKESVMSGKYPIFRPIYQYLKEMPTKDSVVSQFLQFEMSKEGQALIEKSGFYPLTAEDMTKNKDLVASFK